MKILIMSKSFSSPLAWGTGKNGDDVEGYVKLELILSFPSIFHFVVKVPNKSFCYRNPFKALMLALESQCIGMAKYDRLKERVRAIKHWQDL